MNIQLCTCVPYLSPTSRSAANKDTMQQQEPDAADEAAVRYTSSQSASSHSYAAEADSGSSARTSSAGSGAQEQHGRNAEVAYEGEDLERIAVATSTGDRRQSSSSASYVEGQLPRSAAELR